MLEPVERSGNNRFAQSGYCAKRDQVAARSRDVGILKLIGVEAIDSLDLRDYLVASSRDVEAINENELNTEIAVEVKKRQIRETQMDAERAVQEKERLLKEEKMAANISLEEKNKELVGLTVENAKVEADAKAYSLSAVMGPVSKIDPKVLNALASIGMDPSQLIALSFRELAESAAKIGELNISPDLLRELTKKVR